MPKDFGKLRTRQLDHTFERLAPLRSVDRPRKGWLKVIREALGMTGEQVAERLEVTKSMVSKYERAELDETITLATLRRVASALDAELMYAVLPRKSIEELRRERALTAARRRVQSVHQSMALEDQAVSAEERERQIAELADELLIERPRTIWDERD
jgi:predicted DNA-binding mobile mystery protein A